VTTLDDIRLQVGRAEEHLKTLEDAARDFAQSGAYTAEVEFDQKVFEYRVRARVQAAPPGQIRLLIRELVQGLRSTLDNTSYELAVRQTGKDPPPDADGIAFPIFKDATRYRKGSTRALTHIGAAESALIESLQPYRAAIPNEDPLWILHRLANDDKHKRLHVVGFTVAGSRFHVREFRGGGFRDEVRHGPFDDGAVVATFYVGPGHHEMDMQFEFVTALAFRGGGPASGKLLGEVLPNVLGYVRDTVVPKFEPFLR
jgi:hypothetical protein